MKTLVAAALLAISAAPLAATVARADDVGSAIARGAIRGALGDPGYGYRDDYRRDRWRSDRYEGRSAYGGDCRTVTIERDDGSVKRIRRCD